VGLIYALKCIECLAQCCHVTVITDNRAVLHIQDWNPHNRRQRRMLTYIMQFNLTICYIRGSSNTIPNSLSRLFQDSSPQVRRENESKYMHEVGDFIWPVTMRFQNRATVELDGQTTDAPTDRAHTTAAAADAAMVAVVVVARGDPTYHSQGLYQVSSCSALSELISVTVTCTVVRVL